MVAVDTRHIAARIVSSIFYPSLGSFNKYTQIASRAVRQGLKESERVNAEKRAAVGIKYQMWEQGQGGEQVSFDE